MDITTTIQQLPHAHDLPLPAYATPESAGCDLVAAVSGDIVLKPLQRVLIPTGLCIMLADGFEAQVRPRSGLALKHGITVLNSPGTIDADYRGEIQVILINLSSEDFTITRGMRIAQLIIASVIQTAWELADKLPETNRGSGGFGSTGS